MYARVDIVVVNWNSRDLLRRCVESIGGVPDLPLIARVVVVDNASTDGSANRLDTCDGKLDVVRNPVNVGFAAACNQGAQLGSAEFILFLNPDTELVAGAISRVLQVYDSQGGPLPSAIGVQLRTSDNNTVSVSCSRLPTLATLLARATGADHLWPARFPPARMTEWAHDETRWVDQVMGAFFFVRRADFEHMKGFDERFFVYFEEVDYCQRWANHGRRALFLADTHVVHHGRGTTRQVQGTALFYSLQSRVLYIEKHFPDWKGRAVRAITLALEPLVRLGASVALLRILDLTSTLTAYRKLYAWIFQRWLHRGRASKPEPNDTQS